MMLKSLSPNEVKDLLLFSFRYVLEIAHYDVPEWIDYFYKLIPYTEEPGRSYLLKRIPEEIHEYLNDPLDIHRFHNEYSWNKFIKRIEGKLSNTKRSIKSNELRFIHWCSFKYVFGRSTYACSYWVDMFNKSKYELNQQDYTNLRHLILSELDTSFNDGKYMGMSCDVQMWGSFRNKLKEETNA